MKKLANTPSLDEPPMDELRIISDSQTLRELSDPLRRKVLDELTQQAQSGSQIAHKMGIRPSKVHYAIRELDRLGLIRLVGTRPIRGTTEKYFRAVARNFISDLRLGAIASWDTTRLARYLGQPFLQQHRADVLRIDSRTLAHRIVRERMNIQPGEIIHVVAATEAFELVEALVLEIQLAGAEEDMRILTASVTEGLYKELPTEYIERAGRRREFIAEHVDAAIYVNDGSLWSVDPRLDPERVRLFRRRAREIQQRLTARGVRQLVVRPLLYRNLDWDSLRHLEFHDAYWRAVLVSGDELHALAAALRRTLLRQPQVEIRSGDNSILRFRVDASKAIIEDGLCRTSGRGLASLPAGELGVLVDTETANGSVRFDYSPRADKRILGVEMTIENGRIVEARAEEGQSDLDEILSVMPAGGDLVSLFTLGLNPQIPADVDIEKSALYGMTVIDKALGTASVTFGSNLLLGGDRDVPFFWCNSILSPEVRAGDQLILKGNRFALGDAV